MVHVRELDKRGVGRDMLFDACRGKTCAGRSLVKPMMDRR